MPVAQLQWVNESVDRGPDPLMRAPIRQLTNSRLWSWGIYCEQNYASTDGRRVAFLRREPGDLTKQDLWVADLESFEIARIGPTAQAFAASTPLMDSVFYLRLTDSGETVLASLNLKTLEHDDVFASKDCPFGGSPAVSSDGRWFAGHKRVGPNVWALYKVDVKNSRWEFFHEEKDICNTHLQFEPTEGKDLLVQQNRGCVVDAEGHATKLVGEQGCALYVIGIDGKNQRFLPLGAPWTGFVDGHQCWIGATKRVLAAVENDFTKGGIAIVSPGDKEARILTPGFSFIHVNASADARYLVGNQGGHRYVYFGSLKTGRIVHLCAAPCSRAGGHESWEEPYIVPGNRHVVFNSDQTGHAELYAAGVPEHVKAYVDAG